MVHSYAGLLLSNKKKKVLIHATIWMNLKGHMLCLGETQSQKGTWFPFMWQFPKGRTNLYLSEVKNRGWVCLQKCSTREVFGVMKLFCILVVVLVLRIYTCVKIHATVCPKKANFIIWSFLKATYPCISMGWTVSPSKFMSTWNLWMWPYLALQGFAGAINLG